MKTFTESEVIILLEILKIKCAKECDRSSHPSLAILQIDVNKVLLSR